jgi:hypothetical protein
MVVIGDLVYLEDEDCLGLVIRIYCETKMKPPPINALVLWCRTSQKEWCLSEALTIVN